MISKCHLFASSLNEWTHTTEIAYLLIRNRAKFHEMATYLTNSKVHLCKIQVSCTYYDRFHQTFSVKRPLMSMSIGYIKQQIKKMPCMVRLT